MRVGDRMTTDLKTVGPDLDVRAALAVMRQAGIRHLLVVEGDRLLGLVSNRDYRKILEWVRPDGTLREAFTTPIAHIMTPRERLLTTTPDTPMLDAARAMLSRKAGCLPVLDARGRPVGILSQHDVLAALVDPAPPRPS